VSGSVKFSQLEGPERLLGTRLLEFELTAVLGAGGMSVVYRGTHRVTGQEVAIKILPPELAVHDELKARFVEEARVLALLDHPNIVTLNNFVEGAGRLCLIMQFVDGQTFEKSILDAGKVAWQEVARVGIEVLKALEYAHGQSVVHRDIKPSNVLIKTDGTVKVTDFGIAKILNSSRLTSTGQTMGTVRYMSPEQVRGKVVDARSDIYSLGITLYEGLTGRTPFDGENQFDIMQQHLSRKPPPFDKLGVTVPAALEKVIWRSLEKDPAARFQDAKSFREALEAALAQAQPVGPGAVGKGGKKAKGPPPKWVGRAMALGLGVVVALGAGGALFAILRAGKKTGEPKPPITKAVTPSENGATKGGVKDPGPAKPAFATPHTLPGLALPVDEIFEADGLRVQSASARDAGALRDRYRELVEAMRRYMQSPEAAAEVGDKRAELVKAASHAPAPLTLVVVPQATLDKPSLWPGFEVHADSSYPSRYVHAKRTLFIADTAGFERKELPYAVALHLLAPIRALSNDEVSKLAEKFEAYLRRNPTR
jgi:serine/threonine-protein kinase